MKKILSLIFTTLLCAICFAQKSDTLTLKDLEMPISPGFILLDQAPTSIESPNTTKAFTLSVLNSFAQTNGFPKNYAVELTPFWFSKFRNMNALRYAGFKDEKARPFSSLKMVSLSMAYINTNDTVTDKPINNVAFGARTTLLKVYPKGHKDKVLKAILVTRLDLIDLASDLIKAGATDSLKQCCPEEYKKIQERVTQLYSEKDEISPLGDVLSGKPLFSSITISQLTNLGVLVLGQL
jgi:hypothetical protein